jgi:hypothetical protein
MIENRKAPSPQQVRPHRQRAFVRQETDIAAKLFAPDMTTCIHCMVKDISQGGALVAIRGEASVPDRIYLWQDETGTMVECEALWRKLNLVGLKFTDDDPRKVRAFVNSCQAQSGSIAPLGDRTFG